MLCYFVSIIKTNNNRLYQLPRVISSVKNKKIYEGLYPLVLEMRDHPTKGEEKLWCILKKKGFGVKFRRQHVIDQFIVDFYCISLGLIIEVDGGIHIRNSKRDRQRDEILLAMGCTIIRFTNEEIENQIETVILTITEAIKELNQ